MRNTVTAVYNQSKKTRRQGVFRISSANTNCISVPINTVRQLIRRRLLDSANAIPSITIKPRKETAWGMSPPLLESGSVCLLAVEKTQQIAVGREDQGVVATD